MIFLIKKGEEKPKKNKKSGKKQYDKKKPWWWAPVKVTYFHKRLEDGIPRNKCLPEMRHKNDPRGLRENQAFKQKSGIWEEKEI